MSPARQPDSRHLTLDASWRGDGRLADRGYARLERLRACDAHGVRVVIRRQANWKPKVDELARGPVTPPFVPGTKLDALLAADLRRRDGRALDADVQVGGDQHPLPLRLLGGHPPQGSGFFLPNLPPRIGPRQVAALDRVRWEVALRINVDKSVPRRDEVDSARPCSLKTLLHAALIASPIAARRAHTHHLPTRPPQAGAPRTAAPLHPRRRALPLAVSGPSIAQAFDLQGSEATQRWDTIAALRTHSGTDPHWRPRPSVVEQRRGWKRQPVVHRPSSQHPLKAVA